MFRNNGDWFGLVILAMAVVFGILAFTGGTTTLEIVGLVASIVLLVLFYALDLAIGWGLVGMMVIVGIFLWQGGSLNFSPATASTSTFAPESTPEIFIVPTPTSSESSVPENPNLDTSTSPTEYVGVRRGASISAGDFTPPNSTLFSVETTISADPGWPVFFEANRTGDPNHDVLLIEQYFVWPASLHAREGQDARQQSGADETPPEWVMYTVRSQDYVMYDGIGIATNGGWYNGDSCGWFYNNSPFETTIYIRYGEVITIDQPFEVIDEATRILCSRVTSQKETINGVPPSAAYLGEIPLQ